MGISNPSACLQHAVRGVIGCQGPHGRVGCGAASNARVSSDWPDINLQQVSPQLGVCSSREGSFWVPSSSSAFLAPVACLGKRAVSESSFACPRDTHNKRLKTYVARFRLRSFTLVEPAAKGGKLFAPLTCGSGRMASRGGAQALCVFYYTKVMQEPTNHVISQAAPNNFCRTGRSSAPSGTENDCPVCKRSILFCALFLRSPSLFQGTSARFVSFELFSGRAMLVRAPYVCYWYEALPHGWCDCGMRDTVLGWRRGAWPCRRALLMQVSDHAQVQSSPARCR